MTKSEFKAKFLEIYTYLYRGSIDKSFTRVNLSLNKQDVILDKFVDKVFDKYKEGISTDWLVDFTIFQIHYRTTLHWVG